MKKGFTMIELIFVIVILGILAAVAIPRLAGTRADAEITATITNIRTLLSDLSTFYVAKGSFMENGIAATNTNSQNQNQYVKWSQFTNVPLYQPNGGKFTQEQMQDRRAGMGVALGVGGYGCIKLRIIDPSDTFMRNGATGVLNAVVIFNPTTNNSSLCNAVKNSEAVKIFTENKLLKADGTSYTADDFYASGFTEKDKFGVIGIGSSASVYDINFSNAN